MWIGIALNLALRACIIYFALDSILNSEDERYAGKGLPIRNAVIVGFWSMVFPALYILARGTIRLLPERFRPSWDHYPVGWDNLYLSVFWLDMLGNWLNLHNSGGHWDALPHFHGPGALAVIWRGLARRSVLASTGVANMIHALLEVQEYLGDQLAGTQNVQGAGDTAKDLAAALAGSWAYVAAYQAYFRRTRPRVPL